VIRECFLSFSAILFLLFFKKKKKSPHSCSQSLIYLPLFYYYYHYSFLKNESGSEQLSPFDPFSLFIFFKFNIKDESFQE